MPQAELTRQQVVVTERKRTELEFTIDVSPPAGKSMQVFHTDDIDERLPKGSMLNVLCNLLMPSGEKVLIDHVTITPARKRVKITVQLSAELSCEIAGRGRVDTALRTCEFDPSFVV
jgi:hypothetical protein